MSAQRRTEPNPTPIQDPYPGAAASVMPPGPAPAASAGPPPAGLPPPAEQPAASPYTGKPVIVDDSGRPFGSEAEARQYAILRGIPGQYAARPWQGGFALIDLTRIEAHARETVAARPNDPALSREQRFHWVRFHGKRSDDDPQQVQLCVDGAWMIFNRDTDVVIADCHREAADNARKPEYQVVPGQPLKRKGFIARWPYNYIRPATREEYIASVAVGNQQRDRQLNGAAA